MPKITGFTSPFETPFIETHIGHVLVDTTYFLDQFTDTDGVLLDAHTPAPNNSHGLSWASIGTNPVRIASNKAVCNVGIYGSYILDTLLSDVYIKCKITQGTASDGYSGVVMRFVDTTHCWFAKINVTNRFRLSEINGSSTDRASAGPVIDPGVEYTLEITCDGQTITAVLDGTTTISYALATFQETEKKHGFQLRFVGDAIDDYELEVV